MKADVDGLFCSHDQRAACIMQRSKDRSNPTPSEDSFLSSYNNMSKTCQSKQYRQDHKPSPLYHSLERAAALYHRPRLTAHMHSWDSRVYHSPSLIAPKRPSKSSQCCPGHTSRQHDASLCCCFAGVLHSRTVHCSESLAEELEVAALLQVSVFVYMLSFACKSPYFDISLEINHTKASVYALESTHACLNIVQASFAYCILVAEAGSLYV